MPSMLRLLADHFRKICASGAFDSLPVEFLESIGWEEALHTLKAGSNSSSKQAGWINQQAPMPQCHSVIQFR